MRNLQASDKAEANHRKGELIFPLKYDLPLVGRLVGIFLAVIDLRSSHELADDDKSCQLHAEVGQLYKHRQIVIAEVHL